MIQFTVSEKCRSEELLAKFLPPASMDPGKRIQKYAEAIANEMALIHGGHWRVQIDHQAGLVAIVQC